MNVALYTRVSTSDQDCAAQLLELRAHCAQKQWVIAHEFTDTISGTRADRAGLDAMLELVRQRTIDAVCVVKIDRMARSLAHFSVLSGIFVKHKVAIVATSQGIDTTDQNPCGKMMMGFLAVIAEFERDLISERTKAGLAVARANGKILGRPSVKMPPKVDRDRIIRKWIEDDRAGSYEKLGLMLGGVSRATAWRLAKKISSDLPPPDMIDVG
jgi:DNA invertase Pin-like site-specific DNA recombinase